jgi:hypothetical protein
LLICKAEKRLILQISVVFARFGLQKIRPLIFGQEAVKHSLKSGIKKTAYISKKCEDKGKSFLTCFSRPPFLMKTSESYK